MRVWLIDDAPGGPNDLKAAVERLAGRGVRLVLLGAGPFRPGLAAELRECQANLLLVREPAWPEGQGAEEFLELGLGMLVLTAPERCDRFLALGESFPVCLLPPEPDEAQLHLGLLDALAAVRRQAHWADQVAKLQQRLSDRIIIERAKGVLVQRLGISEEEAYKRLRVISRRQRRPIRDIAQSLLDTEWLLLPGSNGFADLGTERPSPPGNP